MTLDLAMISWIWHQEYRQQQQYYLTNSTLSKFKICELKDTINRNAAHRIRENIFKSYIWQGVKTQNIEKLLQLSTKNQPELKKKKKNGQSAWIYISQRRYTIANQYMKRCLTPLIIRKIQIKITVRYHLILK